MYIKHSFLVPGLLQALKNFHFSTSLNTKYLEQVPHLKCIAKFCILPT